MTVLKHFIVLHYGACSAVLCLCVMSFPSRSRNVFWKGRTEPLTAGWCSWAHAAQLESGSRFKVKVEAAFTERSLASFGKSWSQ